MNADILLLESITPDALQILRTAGRVWETEPDGGLEVAGRHPVAAIVTRGKGQVDAALIEACPQLKVIARCGVGLDNIDVAAASRRGVPVVNAPGSNADTVAEHTLALMLMLQRQLWASIQATKEGRWHWRRLYGGDELRGKSLGILGLGNIGKRVATLATAFGMAVMYWDAAEQAVPYPMLPLEQLLPRADICTVHLPLLPSTRALLNADILGLLPPHALLINCARGEIVDQDALLHALDAGRLGGFAADVLATEPPTPEDMALLERPDVLITPHSASLTATTYNEMCVVTTRNVASLLAGQAIEPHFVFNREALAL